MADEPLAKRLQTIEDNTGSGGGVAAGIGAPDDAVATTDTGTFSLIALFKRSLQKLTSLIALFPTALGASGGLKTEIFDSSGVSIDWSGISSVARLLSASGTTQDATNIKASAGRIYKINGVNAVASIRYLKLYNKATAPTVGTDTPVATIQLKASSDFDHTFAAGLAFSTGIGFGLVTASADNSTASVTAADITCLNIYYT